MDIDEFTSFFAQVENTEELIEELDNFRAGQDRKIFVQCGFGTLGILLLGGGWWISQDNYATGVALIALGGMVMCVITTPLLCESLIFSVVMPFLTEWSLYKSMKWVLLCLLAGVGLFLSYVIGSVGEGILIYVYLLCVPFALAVVCVPTFLIGRAAGWMEEPDSESDGELERAVKKRPTAVKTPMPPTPHIGWHNEKQDPGQIQVHR